ncbi:hypothetical protein PXH66_19675 [Synoicihabitans lomoniglobus]|uniref:Uncharacterized protein n=2 Tax=Synoicihabitans lomoniglobus TaxID=2909285 RepID=A0AAF0A0X6_9BACT|nr:hypothetical protein PXH66_19675 [Opitutaceae bacterium LMO-M01]
MAITAWRIRRIQYPPELRWPKDRGQRSRSKSKSKPDSKSPPAD